MNGDTAVLPIITLVILVLTAVGSAGCTYNIVDEPLIEEPVYVEPAPLYVQLEPRLQSIQDSLFNTSCSTSMCHINPVSAATLNLSRNTAYANLVNVPSLLDSTILRVYPGKPDSSYLIWKLEGHPDMNGLLMPMCASGVQCVDPRVVEAVREWIADGALDN